MAETEHPTTPEKRCLICKVKSEERFLLCGIQQGREVWVCVGCLPQLIHGAYH